MEPTKSEVIVKDEIPLSVSVYERNVIMKFNSKLRYWCTHSNYHLVETRMKIVYRNQMYLHRISQWILINELLMRIRDWFYIPKNMQNEMVFRFFFVETDAFPKTDPYILSMLENRSTSNWIRENFNRTPFSIYVPSSTHNIKFDV